MFRLAVNSILYEEDQNNSESQRKSSRKINKNTDDLKLQRNFGTKMMNIVKYESNI